MRIIVWLSPHERIPRPMIGYEYNHSVSSLIHALLRAEGLGHIYERSGYHHFVFSRLMGLIPQRGCLMVPDTVQLHISSPIEEISNAIYVGFKDSNIIRIHSLDFRVKDVQTVPSLKMSGEYRLQTMSPVLIRKYRVDLDKQWHIGPEDDDYADLLIHFTMKRYRDITGSRAKFEVLGFEQVRRKRIHVKGGWFISYDYTVTVESDDAISDFLLQAGLGQKNSMGFGMVKLADEYTRPSKISAMGEESTIQRISV